MSKNNYNMKTKSGKKFFSNENSEAKLKSVKKLNDNPKGNERIKLETYQKPQKSDSLKSTYESGIYEEINYRMDTYTYSSGSSEKSLVHKESAKKTYIPMPEPYKATDDESDNESENIYEAQTNINSNKLKNLRQQVPMPAPRLKPPSITIQDYGNLDKADTGSPLKNPKILDPTKLNVNRLSFDINSESTNSPAKHLNEEKKSKNPTHNLEFNKNRRRTMFDVLKTIGNSKIKKQKMLLLIYSLLFKFK